MSSDYTTKFVRKIAGRENPIMFKKTNKDILREELVDLCIESFKHRKGQKIDLLTLPSAWWNFEKILVKKLRESKESLFFYTTACEKNPKVFKLAASNMPRTDRSLKYDFSEKYQAQRLASNVSTLYYTDIFDYIRETNMTFDFVWLDLMTSLNHFDTKLHYLERCTKKDSLVSITFIKGRDGQKYVGKRKIIVVKMMASIGFDLILEADYYDTSPMIQLTFKRK